jgi:heme exporter protein B
MLGAQFSNSIRNGVSMLAVPVSVFKVVLRRDLVLSYRRRSDVFTTLFFFVIVVSLFPFGIGPEANQLRTMAPGILWVAALLASMLSLGRLFSLDFLDGTLEQMLLGAAPLGLIVVAKVLAHWLVSGLPLVLIAPILGVMFDLPADQLIVLTLSLALGTPVLSLIGAVGAALTLGLRGGGVLVSLLVLPLYVPVLIFGAGAVSAQAASIGPQSHLYLLGAFLVVSSLFAPWAAAAGLRISLE